MRPSTSIGAPKRPQEMEDDQYRRPTCGGYKDADRDSEQHGPGRTGLQDLLDQYCL